MLAGADVVSIVGRNDSSLTVNVDGGAGSDTIVLPGTAGNDTYAVTPGASSDAGAIAVRLSTAGVAFGTPINFTTTEGISIDGGGGAGIDTLSLNGTGANNAFTLTGTAALAGTAKVDAGPNISFANIGSGGSDINLNGLGGDDTFAVTTVASWGIDDVNIDGESAFRQRQRCPHSRQHQRHRQLYAGVGEWAPCP